MKSRSILVTLLAGALSCAAMAAPGPSPSAFQADSPTSRSADRKMTQQIRKALMEDKALSMAAHNVKIFVKDGQVTLKGEVRSAEEKQAVVEKATAVAGPGHVTDDLMVQGAESN